MPPVDILFAHIARVETMKSQVENVMSERGKTPKRTASFSSVSISNSGRAVANANSHGSRSVKSKKKKKKDVPEELDSSGSQSPGERIGSDHEDAIMERVSEEDELDEEYGAASQLSKSSSRVPTFGQSVSSRNEYGVSPTRKVSTNTMNGLMLPREDAQSRLEHQ